MDDTVRNLRARQWKTEKASEPSDLKPAHETEESQKVNFGARHATEVPSHSDDDAELMREQLKRASTPYIWKPEELAKSNPTPGSFPDTHPLPTKASSSTTNNTTKDEQKPDIKVEEDERTCRICFSPQTAEEKLISPCKCKGTSKWIHLSCLNEWRKASRNSKSFYRCDQCYYEYSFRRTDFAQLLTHPYTLLALTAACFTFAMFIGGFLVKLGLYLYPPERMIRSSGWFSSFFYTPFDAGTDMLSAASALVPTTPRNWREIFVVDIWHFFQGFISLGIIGVVGFLGTGGLFSLRTFMPNGRRRRQQGDAVGLGELAFIVVLLLGCGKVAQMMWKRVRQFVKLWLASLGERILEVDPDKA